MLCHYNTVRWLYSQSWRGLWLAVPGWCWAETERCRERAGWPNLPWQPTSEARRPEHTQTHNIRENTEYSTLPSLYVPSIFIDRYCQFPPGDLLSPLFPHTHTQVHISSHTHVDAGGHVGLPLLGCWTWWPRSHWGCYWSCCWGSWDLSLVRCCMQTLEHTRHRC